MSARTDLDQSVNAEATDLLLAQRAAYSTLLDALGDARVDPGSADLDGLRELVAISGRLLTPLSTQSTALSSISRRLRQPDCEGPRANAARRLLSDVGSQASEARSRLDELVATLRKGQQRILEEIKALEQDTPTAYHHPPTGPALLVDRTG